MQKHGENIGGAENSPLLQYSALLTSYGGFEFSPNAVVEC